VKDQPKDLKNDMTLPMLVMTPSDVNRLRRELSVLDDYLKQQSTPNARPADGEVAENVCDCLTKRPPLTT